MPPRSPAKGAGLRGGVRQWDELEVPARVFPKESPPAGRDGWKAIVTCMSLHASEPKAYVVFEGGCSGGGKQLPGTPA